MSKKPRPERTKQRPDLIPVLPDKCNDEIVVAKCLVAIGVPLRQANANADRLLRMLRKLKVQL
jgi:hypothetical protein